MPNLPPCSGAEALFNLVTAAKEFVEHLIEQDTEAAMRALVKIDATQGGSIMKRIGHDPDLVQVLASPISSSHSRPHLLLAADTIPWG